MSAFYDRMQATATRLLSQYGSAVVFQDALGVTLGQGIAVQSTNQLRNIPQTLIEESDSVLNCSHMDYTPSAGDYVRFNGALMMTVQVDNIAPDGQNLMYRVFVRGARQSG